MNPLLPLVSPHNGKEETHHAPDHRYPFASQKTSSVVQEKLMRGVFTRTPAAPIVTSRLPETLEQGGDLLSTMLREGAQRLVAEAVQIEFEEFWRALPVSGSKTGVQQWCETAFSPSVRC